ncbi:hypothetical protein IFM89_032895 [Coptis chinensis]|uniref:Uncharacterized protein n=1 Tax=Coptis chinensis TaxID=261450 RepID=A0A835IPG0_9MAGN|nr:hypothetical protein IFM89_032895 [Coptis chinensis]
MAWFAAKSYKEVNFKKWMDKIGSAKKEAREWLEKENVESWASVPQIINPSPHVIGSGRPEKQRRREEDEDATSSTKIMTFQSFHLPGHNSRTCKGLPANIAKNANKEKEAATKKATTKKASAEKSKKGRSKTSKEKCGTNGGGGVVDTTAAASSSQSNTPTSMFIVPTQTKAPNIMPHLTSSRSPAF